MTHEQSSEHKPSNPKTQLGRQSDRQLATEFHLGQERRFHQKGRIYVRDAPHLFSLALEEESIYGLEIMTSTSACPARKRRGFCCPDLVLEISLAMAPEREPT
jgi:hypothetical protein